MRRITTTLMLALLLIASVAGPTLACGGLIGPNGAVNLLRTTTFAGYHDGVEHYVTAFEFAGGGGAFGSITPLPDIPSKVERGGDWTLQRLVRETTPADLRLSVDAFAEDAGLILDHSAAATDGLLTDLRSDAGMEWVPESAWLTKVVVDSPAVDLDFDLAIDASGADRPSPVDAGFAPFGPEPAPRAPVALYLLLAAAAII